MMSKGICFRAFVPVREKADHHSAMMSQVLFGESFSIVGSWEDWLLIQPDLPGPEGWVDKKSIWIYPEKDKGRKNSPALVIHPSIHILDLGLGEMRILPAGSTWKAGELNHWSVSGREFELISREGMVLPGPDVNPNEIARRLLSTPVIQGGRSGFGFDAPGLIQFVCRCMGKHIPRYAGDQALEGNIINFMHEVQCGDLAFFDNEEEEIVHVGMVLEENRILHADLEVRIDYLDHHGIYNKSAKDYSHKLRVIKRIPSGS